MLDSLRIKIHKKRIKQTVKINKIRKMISKLEKIRETLIIVALALLLGCPASNSSGQVIKSVPTEGQTDFPRAGNIVLTYSGTVVEGNGNITIKPENGPAVSIAVGDAQVTIAPSNATTTVTINPIRNLFAATDYTLNVPAGAFKIGNELGADAPAYTLSFTTAPATLPEGVVTRSIPPNLETQFPANVNIVLTYSGSVIRGSGNITIMPETEAEVLIPVSDTALVAVSASTMPTTVTIDPTENLPEGEVTIAIPAGVFKIGSELGADAPPYTLSFTAIAADTTAPTIISRTPAHQATGVNGSEPTFLLFDDRIFLGSGSIRFQALDNLSGTRVIPVNKFNQVSIIPTDDENRVIIRARLSANERYRVTIPAGAFVNYAGLPNAVNGSNDPSQTSWTFTTQ